MRVVFRCDPALIDLLPRPVPARAALPDWLRRMAPRVPSPVHQRTIRTVKQCPPFADGDGPAALRRCEAMSDKRRAGHASLAGRIRAGPGVYRKGYRSKRGGG